MRMSVATILAFGAPLLSVAAPAAREAPAFSRGYSSAEQPTGRPATCATLAAAPAALPKPGTRVDLTVSDVLTLVHGDGTLTYLAVCSEPGPRVLCVAYSANGLRVGDRAVLRGGYNRQDATHVVLDPCLASRAD